MGVPLTIYFWIQGVFLIVLLDGLFGIAALILATPLWLDLIIAGIGIAVPLALYVILQCRPTFKPHLFIALVLVPLGIPGTHLMARLTKVGVVEVAGTAGIAAIKYVDDVAPLTLRHADEIVEVLPVVRNLPHVTETLAGPVRFVNTMAKGRFGDALTARRMTISGARNTAQKVRALIESGSPAVSKELWQHDLATGITTVRSVDANGKLGAMLRSWQDSFIKNRLVDTCRADSLLCSFVDQR